jgi:hypothetical protein
MSLSGIGTKREQWFAKIGGAAGAAFAGSVLLLLQDTPVDSAQYFTGEIQGFGLFNFHGTPRKNYYAFKAFSQLLDCPIRLTTPSSPETKWVFGAGLAKDKQSAAILACNLRCPDSNLTLELSHAPWTERTHFEVFCVNDQYNLDRVETGVILNHEPRKLPSFAAPTVLLIKLKP